MQERTTMLIVSGLLIIAGPILFFQAVHLQPTVYSYDSKEITDGRAGVDIELSDTNIHTYEQLSKDDRRLFKYALGQTDRRTKVQLRNSSLRNASYVRYNSSFHSIEIGSGRSGTFLEVTRVPPQSVLGNNSVSISTFSSKTYFGLRKTETRRQVVKNTIQNGEHKSMTYVNPKKVVEYEGKYYRITTSTTGYFSNLLLLVLVLGAMLGITFPLLGSYVLYESVI